MAKNKNHDLDATDDILSQCEEILTDFAHALSHAHLVVNSHGLPVSADSLRATQRLLLRVVWEANQCALSLYSRIQAEDNAAEIRKLQGPKS